MSLPLIRDKHFINAVTHSLTGTQILYYLGAVWAKNTSQSCVLWCMPKDAENKRNAVRVALSKERNQRNVPRTFELRFSEPFPWTMDGFKGEAITVYRVTGGRVTQVKAAFSKLGL